MNIKPEDRKLCSVERCIRCPLGGIRGVGRTGYHLPQLPWTLEESQTCHHGLLLGLAGRTVLTCCKRCEDAWGRGNNQQHHAMCGKEFKSKGCCTWHALYTAILSEPPFMPFKVRPELDPSRHTFASNSLIHLYWNDMTGAKKNVTGPVGVRAHP
jgi:hypothetical protein